MICVLYLRKSYTYGDLIFFSNEELLVLLQIFNSYDLFIYIQISTYKVTKLKNYYLLNTYKKKILFKHNDQQSKKIFSFKKKSLYHHHKTLHLECKKKTPIFISVLVVVNDYRLKLNNQKNQNLENHSIHGTIILYCTRDDSVIIT